MGYEIMFIGLVLALGYVSLTGYYPGGIIVPGYLVLFADQPYRMAGTLVAALLTLAVYSFASRHLILFGKRRFVFLILLGALFSVFLSYFAPLLFPASFDYRVIGLVIPGLIAGNFERQGVAITTASLAIVVTITWFAGQILISFT
jgi:poly-gamma-glutamate biosynthesis protein PgsC/CapC